MRNLLLHFYSPVKDKKSTKKQRHRLNLAAWYVEHLPQQIVRLVPSHEIGEKKQLKLYPPLYAGTSQPDED